MLHAYFARLPVGSTKDIYFETVEDDINEDSLLSPFVQLPNLRPPSSNPAIPVHDAAAPGVSFGIRNRQLYNIGILLLELILNGPIASFGLLNKNEIAWRMEEQVLSRAGPIWADVVFKCLHCPYQQKPELEDNEFFDLVYTDIVKPLVDMVQLPKLKRMPVDETPRGQPRWNIGGRPIYPIILADSDHE